MGQVVRDGVDPRWVKMWKKEAQRFKNRSLRTLSEYAILREYADGGECKNLPVTGDPNINNANPPLMKWERFKNELTNYALHAFRVLEVDASGSNVADWSAILRVFAMWYTIAFSGAYKAIHVPIRFKGRRARYMEWYDAVYLALGTVMGCQDEVVSLLRLHEGLFAKDFNYREGDVVFYQQSPIYNFVFGILGDYFGRSQGNPVYRSVIHPLFQALRQEWATEDSNRIEELLLAVCDHHTYQCRSSKDDRPSNDFDHGFFRHTPFEVLLVMKLRQLRGLETPVLDHPLMSGGLGVLPAAMRFEQIAEGEDDLIWRVRQRMLQEDFDEQAILKYLCES